MSNQIEKATKALTEARSARSDAQRKLTEAGDERERLRARVATGDDKVTGADLADADQALELAKLRLAAADSNTQAAETALRDAEHDQLRADIQSIRSGPGRDKIAQALEKADDALQALDEVCTEQQDAVAEITRRAATLQPLPDGMKLNGGRLHVGTTELTSPSMPALIDALEAAHANAQLSAPPPWTDPLKTYASTTLRKRYDKATT